MKICFIGYTGLREYSGGKSVSFAGVNYQRKYLSYLSKREDIDLQAHLIVEVPVFPKSQNLFIKSSNLVQYECKAETISFINVPFFKMSSIVHAIRRIVESVYKSDPDTIFVTYNFDMEIAKACENIIPMSKVYCILADLPLLEINKNRLVGMYLKRKQKKSLRKLQLLNNAIIINRNQLDYLRRDVNYVLIEGGVDADDICEIRTPSMQEFYFNVLYSGAITEYSGLKLLIEACELLSRKLPIYLIIYGNHEKEVIRKSSRFIIEYMGFVENSIVRQKQNEVDLLVNPRIINNAISMTTFPSKILEYSLSATPILMTKIQGIPEDYYRYIDYCDDTVDSLVKKMDYILQQSDEEKKTKIQKRHEYLRSEKTWETQVERLMQFITKTDAIKEES